MRIKIEYFDNQIVINNECINVIEIENKKSFYRLVSDLYSIIENNYPDSIICFDKDGNELNLSDKLKIYVDFFNFNFDSKKYNNDIMKYLNENISDVDKDILLKQYNKFISSYYKVLNDIDIPLSINNDTNIDNIVKTLKISIETKSELLDNLLLLIDIEKNLSMKNVLIFVNLKQYLNKEELVELYKYSMYNQVNIVLIDSQSYGVKLEYEKKLIIDQDLDEFML